jgi:hypothetical protein
MYLTHLEYGEALSISTFKNGFFGLQNSAVPLGHREKNFFVNFERYDLTNDEEMSVYDLVNM